jgi:outer membrane protein OmpA-like peptidoglycan-associated protein
MPNRYVVASGMLLVALSTRAAFAQAPGFALDRFDASERGSDWFTLESLDFRGHLRPAGGLVAEWAHKPLVTYGIDGSEHTSLVADQFVLHAGGTLIFWDRARFALDVPLALYQAGDNANAAGTSFTAPSGASLGDIRLGVDALAIGKYRGPVSLAGGVQVYLPTGDRNAFTGDGKARLVPRLLAAGAFDKFEYAAKLGFDYRAQNDAFGGSPMGSELFLGAAAGVRPIDELVAGAEIDLSTGVEDADAFFKRRTTPLELLFGAHYAVAPEWRIGGGVGPGLTRAFGTPQVRFVLSAEYVAAFHEPAPPLPPPPPPARSDRDNDGIFDDEDACPDVPGVRTEDPKTNGCPPPPPDRDKDSIVDSEDACPDVPGVKTDDPKTNGCPPDRDKDGIVDAEDACPDVPGVKTDDPKTNGCPPDRDKDGIVDAEDACPDVPGEKTDDPKTNGCPPARIEQDEIKISKQVQFKFDSDVILPESDLVLGAIATILNEHSEITRVRIEGHTDDKGTEAYNMKLSQRRAASVVKWLVKHGIAQSRLTSQGFGRSRPIDRNDTDEGRAMNRRVELHIQARKAPKKLNVLPAKPPPDAQ